MVLVNWMLCFFCLCIAHFISFSTMSEFLLMLETYVSSLYGPWDGFSVKHLRGSHIHMQVGLLVHGCGSLHAALWPAALQRQHQWSFAGEDHDREVWAIEWQLVDRSVRWCQGFMLFGELGGLNIIENINKNS